MARELLQSIASASVLYGLASISGIPVCTGMVPSLTIIDNATNEKLQVIPSGETAKLQVLPRRQGLSLRADTSDDVCSVLFDVDSPESSSMQILVDSPPFTLGPEYNKFLSSVGTHTISATPFIGPMASTTKGTTIEVTFHIMESNRSKTETSSTSDSVIEEVKCCDTNIQRALEEAGEDEDEDKLVMGLVLVNSQTQQDLLNLTDGSLVDISAIGTSLTVRAITAGWFASILFDFDGIFVDDSREPYTLSRTLWHSEPTLVLDGDHTITVSAHPWAKGLGKSLDNITMSFTITGSAVDLCKLDAPKNIPQPFASDVPAYTASATGSLNGELRMWHKITLGFTGPTTCERATPNPFTYYRLDVTFTNPASGIAYTVPGYYAADGNAANTGATSGNVWLVHFSPDRNARWFWSASFTQGEDVAQDGGGTSAGFFDGATGAFTVSRSDKTGRDHRGKGRLEYVGEHHLRFAGNGEWFLKVGVDSPENFLAYDDFDGTSDFRDLRKSWEDHHSDYNSDDPTWAGGKGKAIIGVVNYLSGAGLNVFSFLPFSAGGDDRNVQPHVSAALGDDQLRIDVSKTAQWEILFEHADHMGMYMHFKTQEQENDQRLDGGELGPARKLYYRELIARFSHHLALNWNIGEENTNTDEQRMAFGDYFKAIDPYKHPIVLHTGTYSKERIYGPLLGLSSYNGVSMQCEKALVFNDTLTWVTASKQAGHKWVVANDEQALASEGLVPDEDDPDHDVVRKEVLWGNIMAGGAGVEYYFGYLFPNSDLNCETFRTRANMWTQSRHALNFFMNYRVPFWEMSNDNSLVSGDDNWCLVNSDYTVVVVYIQNGGIVSLNLSAVSISSYSVLWYHPRTGVSSGVVTNIVAADSVSLEPPSGIDDDWAVLLEANEEPTSNPTVAPTTAKPTSMPIPWLTTVLETDFAKEDGFLPESDIDNEEPDPSKFVFVKDMFVDGDDQFTHGFHSFKKGKHDEVAGIVSGGLVVHLGGFNETMGYNMSAGFRYEFMMAHEYLLTVAFDYQVLWSRRYADGEESRLMLGIDSTTVFEFDYFNNSSPTGLSGWKKGSVNVGIVGAGSHYLDLGGINNYKDHKQKRTYIYFDHILFTGTRVTTTPTIPPTDLPTRSPTSYPTLIRSTTPSSIPSGAPSVLPTTLPTTTSVPTVARTSAPTTTPLTVLAYTDFDNPPDASGFAFTKDLFVDGDDQYTQGFYVGAKGKPDSVTGEATAGIFVQLGGFDSAVGYNMSAGFRYGFATFEDVDVLVQFDYQVSWPDHYDSDESSRIMMGIDSEFAFDVDFFDSSSPTGTSEWKTAFVEAGQVGAGLHYLDLGGINNKKDHRRELTSIYFDHVIIMSKRASAQP